MIRGVHLLKNLGIISTGIVEMEIATGILRNKKHAVRG